MKYYSEKTQKLYESEEELKQGELEFDSKELEIQKRKEERSQAAKVVEDAFKRVEEAQKTANSELNAFVKKYGSYHKTISSPVCIPDGVSLFDFLFKDLFDF